MDNEGFFAEDEPTGVARGETTCATSCPDCSSNLGKFSEDSDSYNPLCEVCRKRLGEAVAYLISQWRLQAALNILVEQGAVLRPSKPYVPYRVYVQRTFFFILGVLVGCISEVLVMMQDLGPPN